MAKKYNVEKLTPRPVDEITDLFGEKRKQRLTENVEEEIIGDGKNQVIDIPIAKLLPYPNHHFRRPEGDKWQSFVESIRTHGVLQPIIVRRDPIQEDCYQMLSGHCRTEASKECSLITIPAIILDMEDDIEASVLVGLTNKQREEISDVDWGFTYRETYELMKRQGERRDLTSSHNETKLDDEMENTLSHDETKLKGRRTDDIIAEKYGESRATIQRKIRLTYLISDFAAMVEQKKMKQSIAVELSYLKEDEQEHVNTVIFCEKVKLNDDMAKTLKKASNNADIKGAQLTLEEIQEIILSMDKKKEAKEKFAKYIVPDEYFPKELKKKEKEEYILRALKYIQDNQIILEESNVQEDIK